MFTKFAKVQTDCRVFVGATMSGYQNLLMKTYLEHPFVDSILLFLIGQTLEPYQLLFSTANRTIMHSPWSTRLKVSLENYKKGNNYLK